MPQNRAIWPLWSLKKAPECSMCSRQVLTGCIWPELKGSCSARAIQGKLPCYADVRCPTGLSKLCLDPQPESVCHAEDRINKRASSTFIAAEHAQEGQVMQMTAQESPATQNTIPMLLSCHSKCLLDMANIDEYGLPRAVIIVNAALSAAISMLVP